MKKITLIFAVLICAAAKLPPPRVRPAAGPGQPFKVLSTPPSAPALPHP